MSKKYYIVVIHDKPRKMFLSEGDGDPCRTYLRDHAHYYNTEKDAETALKIAQEYRPFEDAYIERA